MTNLTAAQLLVLGFDGVGTAEEPKCPHCAINHEDNGYSYHEVETPHEEFEHSCLGCNGEWGAAVYDNEQASFYSQFVEAGGTQPRSICKALRTVARQWQGTKMAFVEAAVAAGLNKGNAQQEFNLGRK